METVSTYENDVLKSQTVNGVPQAVTNQGNDVTVTGREKTGKDVDATAGKETVAGQGAHGGEGGAEEMEKYKNVQTIEEDASAGNETVEGVVGGEGAVEEEKNGDSSSALPNGGTLYLSHLTHCQGLTGRVFQLRVGSGSGIGKNYRVGSGSGSGIGNIY